MLTRSSRVAQVLITEPGHVAALRPYLLQGYKVQRVVAVGNDDFVYIRRVTPASVHNKAIRLCADGTAADTIIDFRTRL